MDDAVAAMGRMGLWLQETKSLWSLSSAIDNATTTDALEEIISPRLSVHVVFLLQQEVDAGEDKKFYMDQNDINTFLQSLFGDQKECEWTCEHNFSSTTLQVGISGGSRYAIHIKLSHRFHRGKNTLQSTIIRDLCTKLVGLHHFSTYEFQVIPDWGTGLHLQGEDQRKFGSYLILMQLADIYDHYLLDANLSEDEKRRWAEQVIGLSQCFVRQYGRLLTFSSDEELETAYSAIALDPSLGRLPALLCQLAEAMSSSGKMLEVVKSLKKVPRRDLANLAISSMIPVYRSGMEVHKFSVSIDIEIDHLVGPLRRVMATNTILSCAVSILVTNLENRSRIKASWTLLGFFICSFGSLLPFAILVLGGSLVTHNILGWIITVIDTRRVEKVNEFSNKVGDMTKDTNQTGLLAACCKLHLLAIIIKAGSFLEKEKGTRGYECYRRLLDGQFGINTERTDQINGLVQQKTSEICQSIRDAQERMVRHALKFGIRPEFEV